MIKSVTCLVSAIAIGFAGISLAQAAPQGEPTPALDDASSDNALAAWEKIYEVFSHPRCANCHVADDRPRWSGAHYGLAKGEWQYHGMNIHGGASRIGIESIPCSTCHTAENSDAPHGPPGNEVWALAPAEMVWWQKSSAEICEQIKDPLRNGGRSLEEVADHISHDSLVLWGWNPGPGREPAPYSAQATADRFLSWAAAGAPCPSVDTQN